MKWKVALALLVLLALASATAKATTVIPMSVEELTHAAKAIVEATATSSWSQWNPQHTMIVTYTRFTVSKTLKGSVPAEIVVKQPGGIVGNQGQKVPGVRQFLAGENVLLYLQPSGDNDGTHVVTGLVQGNFRIYKTAAGVTAVTNGMPGVSRLRAGGFSEYHGTSMRLDEMESRVQRALR
ncbi:MAG: hypothetical protein ACE14M_08515 [Terriglobales bacterium]